MLLKVVLGIVSVITLLGCNTTPQIMEKVDHLFGQWLHERVEYSNSVFYPPPGNQTFYVFKEEFLYFTNNLSNYSGEVWFIEQGFTNAFTVVWSVDLKNNKLYLDIDVTNFAYTVNMVAVDSTNVNYLWLMDGVYRVSNRVYYFFVSNNVRRYLLRKL